MTLVILRLSGREFLGTEVVGEVYVQIVSFSKYNQFEGYACVY